MKDDILRGQYDTGKGLIARLDPRSKLYILIVYVMLTLISRDIPMLLGASVFLMIAYFESMIPILSLLRSARSVLILLVISELFSLIWAAPLTVLMTFWRLLLITLMSVIFSRTTAPRDILDSFREGFPVTEGAAMSLTIAFDFLPQLGWEMEDLKCAAISRGALLTEGSVAERVRDYLPLLIPLFRRTIRHAGHLADAMDLRGYDSDAERSRMEPLEYGRTDRLTITVFFLFVAAMVTWRILHL